MGRTTAMMKDHGLSLVKNVEQKRIPGHTSAKPGRSGNLLIKLIIYAEKGAGANDFFEATTIDEAQGRVLLQESIMLYLQR
jgi:hypothetical protein